MKKVSIALGLLVTLSTASVSIAQQTNTMNSGSATIGDMSREEFKRMNEKGAATVSSVTPTKAKLSKADQDLMMQVAMGGMMQLEISRIAMQKASNEIVRQLAQAEVEEQSGLSAKLKEIASAKGITLPTSPDSQTQAMITRMNGMTGAAFDRFYVQESGVNGHEKLDKVMSQVKSSASDESLKSLAAAAHPLVKTHLQVARESLTKMGGNGGTMNR